MSTKKPHTEYTKQEVVDAIKQIKTPGEPLSKIEFELHDETPSMSPVESHFGSWSAAMDEIFGEADGDDGTQRTGREG